MTTPSATSRRFIALAVLVLGVLQAWDSGAFGTGPLVATLALVGVALAGLPLLVSREVRVWLAGVILSALVLTIARIVSPVSLNTLHLIAFAGAIGTFVCSGVFGRAATR